MVSVILPTYNRVSLLRASIESILKQSYSKLELVIVDDCSSDDTNRLLQNLRDPGKRIQICHNQCRKGLPFSRNKGVSLSKGSLIFFSEDDLLLESDCISILVDSFQALVAKNPLIGGIGPRLINEPKVLSKEVKGEKIVKISRVTGDISCNFGLESTGLVAVSTLHSCSLISRLAFLKNGGFETRLYRGSYVREETDFYFRLRKNGYELYFEPRASVHHWCGAVGGCILHSKATQEYYNIRNHLMYLVRFYGLLTFFMFPCFLFVRLLLR